MNFSQLEPHPRRPISFSGPPPASKSTAHLLTLDVNDAAAIGEGMINPLPRPQVTSRVSSQNIAIVLLCIVYILECGGCNGPNWTLMYYVVSI